MGNYSTIVLQQTRSVGMTRQLGQAIGLLKFSNRELAAFLAFHEMANPYLKLQLAPAPRKHGQSVPKTPPTGAATANEHEQIAAGPATLHAHARHEIGLLLRDSEDMRIAEYFVEALEPTGWLGKPVEDIARGAKCSVDKATAILSRIQQIEPAGLFARNLSECLRLQAEDAGLLTGSLPCVLGNLPLLAAGDLDTLAKTCGCDRKDVLSAFETIRRFNPKPGTAFDPHVPRDTPPDLIVTRREDGAAWEVELNGSTLPKVNVVEESGLPDVDRRMMEAAKAVARALERRNYTTLQIAAEVVRQQADFLLDGPRALRPLSFRDVAAAVGVHASTVSRVTTGLRVATPRGPLSLRDFFSGALRCTMEGEDVAAGAVRRHIADMIAAEDPGSPLSDSAIADRLATEGIRIARRTVAKYRDAMKIAGSADRRARAAARRG